jgi:hypothetical protein
MVGNMIHYRYIEIFLFDMIYNFIQGGFI